MSHLGEHLLTAIVFLPALGAVIALAFPRDAHSGVRGFALTISLIDLALVLWMWARFEPGTTAMQMVESAEWVPSLGISFSLGVDGLSLLLVVLTAALAPVVILSTYSSVNEGIRGYMVCLLLLQTALLGAFAATDLFLFYVCWQVMLIPMVFLIGIWGGRNRIYAAIKFFVYITAGSLLMLVAILYTVWAVKDSGGPTFSFDEIVRRLAHTDLGNAEVWLFLAFALAFAIKVPMVPFHTWMPDAHVEAPTGGSVILAGVLLKLGVFGFLRYALWLFPEAAAAFLPAIGLVAVVGILYGALLAMVQDDFKRLVAFSSVSHLGFVMLGIAAMTVTGVAGGVLQMVNHGISTGGLFLLVGVLYERRQTHMLEDFGGIARVMPRYAMLWGIIMLGSMGLPGLNGFVGELMILVGAFQSQGLVIDTETGSLAKAGIAAAGVVALGAILLLVLALSRQSREQVGLGTRVATILGAVALAVFLVAPPVAGTAGGLLIRPLVGPVHSSAPFRETFAALAVLAGTGVIFAAVYLLRATQKVFFGPLCHAENRELRDLSVREGFVLGPLVLCTVLIGIYPQPLLDSINPTVRAYAREFRLRAKLPAMSAADRRVFAPPEARSARPDAHDLEVLQRPANTQPIHNLRRPVRDLR